MRLEVNQSILTIPINDYNDIQTFPQEIDLVQYDFEIHFIVAGISSIRVIISPEAVFKLLPKLTKILKLFIDNKKLLECYYGELDSYIRNYIRIEEDIIDLIYLSIENKFEHLENCLNNFHTSYSTKSFVRRTLEEFPDETIYPNTEIYVYQGSLYIMKNLISGTIRLSKLSDNSLILRLVDYLEPEFFKSHYLNILEKSLIEL